MGQREIVTKLDGEKPRNSLDMRGRLDSKGERYGEVIKFKYVCRPAENLNPLLYLASSSPHTQSVQLTGVSSEGVAAAIPFSGSLPRFLGP